MTKRTPPPMQGFEDPIPNNSAAMRASFSLAMGEELERLCVHGDTRFSDYHLKELTTPATGEEAGKPLSDNEHLALLVGFALGLQRAGEMAVAQRKRQQLERQFKKER